MARQRNYLMPNKLGYLFKNSQQKLGLRVFFHIPFIRNESGVPNNVASRCLLPFD